MTIKRRLWHGLLTGLFLTGLLLLFTALRVFAHPMGNFSINHYTRLDVTGDRINGRYVLDMAEIPTVSEQSRLDANQDGKVSAGERAAYLQAQCAALAANLTLTVNGRPLPLDAQPDDLALRPGAGGLQTLRLTLRLNAILPATPQTAACVVTYNDNNFPNRTGWKEIVVRSASGVVRDASVSSLDVSKELTVYPADPGTAPPQDTQARFTVEPVGTGTGNVPVLEASPSVLADATAGTAVYRFSQNQSRNSGTPQDRFTQSIADTQMTPLLMLLALVSAFGFGAVHALSPGHGKAMVAAYLVGTRGTAWHAVLLGLVVTLTHTLGVFALGLITLSASRHIVPEKLYPIISAVSGLLVALMGVGLLVGRWRAWRNTEEGERGRGGEGENAFVQVGEVSEPDEFYRQRRAGGDVSLRGLIGLGITGGALPCPSALVVMLSAIALHRIGFGLLLIVSFSLGLAVVLTALGLLMMRARNLLERFPTRGRLMAGVSVLSAGIVTIIGIALFVRALSGQF